MATKHSICSICKITYNRTEIAAAEDIFSHGYCLPHFDEVMAEIRGRGVDAPPRDRGRPAAAAECAL